ncbi:glycosyltransferase family A protein [Paracoccus pacificus]|uniref:Glycosyltransferase family A protein n=2 Tax=Paracoccus pacificus TaxID=1463598 RepID=A0ABW4R7H5_9RHOB
MTPTISAIVTGHRERRLSIPTLRSFGNAIADAQAQGYTVEAILCLDRPDTLTEEIFHRFAPPKARILTMDHGDQGKVRNDAVVAATGQFVAFLDGDDLWQKSWLHRAADFLIASGRDDYVAHPAYNYFFEGQATTFRQIDQDSPDFDIDLLRMRNYWDALSMAPRSIHERFPYAHRDIPNGWALEDWQWNEETIAAGIRHKIVPDTVLFKRRQKESQHSRAAKSKATHRRNGMTSYSAPIFAAFDGPTV